MTHARVNGVDLEGARHVQGHAGGIPPDGLENFNARRPPEMFNEAVLDQH